MNTPYPDSKTFVDMKIRESPAAAWKAFDKMMMDTKDNPSRDDIKNFIEKNFEVSNSSSQVQHQRSFLYCVGLRA